MTKVKRMRGALLKVTTRSFWGVLDQGLASIGTLALSSAIARSASVGEFGAFGTAFAVYSIVQTAGRAAISMPYLMKAAKTSSDDVMSRERGGALGFGVAFGLAAGFVVAFLGVVLGGEVQSFFLLIGAGLVVLTVQDAYRFLLLDVRGIKAVAINDGAWTTAQIALSVPVLIWPSYFSPELFVVAWLVGSAIAAFCAGRALRLKPNLKGCSSYYRDTRSTGGPLLVESIAISGSTQAGQFSAASVGGIATVGPLRGGQVLLGPVSVVAGGLTLLATPAILRRGAKSRSALIWSCFAVAVAVSIVCLFSAVLAQLLPDEVGSEILGASWIDSQVVVVPLAVALAASSFANSAMLGFRALGIARKTMILRCLMFPIPPVAAGIGAAVGGSLGAAFGLATAAVLVAAVLWISLLLESGRNPEVEGPREVPFWDEE